MPLRVELKPFERLVIGDSVIINSGTRTCFLVEGATPVLREKDTVTAATANTPAKRLYLCVQTMYLKNDATRQRERFLGLIKELREAIPESGDTVDAIEKCVSAKSLYKALKEIRKLMKREDELIAV
jgi:flagellar protein FlbT